MLPLYQQLITNQYQATLRMLFDAVQQCPDELWHEPIVELKFCQVAFHTLFFTDLYLGRKEAGFREQEFHRQHAETFADYEELEPVRQQHTYEKSFVELYLQFCREKANCVAAAETEESLQQTPGFDWLEFSRAEVHFYNIRHVHHHAAQMSLFLRMRGYDGVRWRGSGWPTD